MEGTESSHHDRMAQPLYLTCSSEWLWISALKSDMEGTNPLTMIEWLSPYIWPWKEPILSPCQNGSRTHHFPLEGISISWTPSFSLKHSTSLWLMASSTHQLSVHPSQHTRASLLPSTPYPWYSDTWYRYVSTCHGTPSSLKTSHNSGCHNIYK